MPRPACRVWIVETANGRRTVLGSSNCSNSRRRKTTIILSITIGGEVGSRSPAFSHPSIFEIKVPLSAKLSQGLPYRLDDATMRPHHRQERSCQASVAPRASVSSAWRGFMIGNAAEGQVLKGSDCFWTTGQMTSEAFGPGPSREQARMLRAKGFRSVSLNLGIGCDLESGLLESVFCPGQIAGPENPGNIELRHMAG